MVILSTNPASILSRQSSPWIGVMPVMDDDEPAAPVAPEPAAPVAPAPPVLTVQGQATPPAAVDQA